AVVPAAHVDARSRQARILPKHLEDAVIVEREEMGMEMIELAPHAPAGQAHRTIGKFVQRLFALQLAGRRARGISGQGSADACRTDARRGGRTGSAMHEMPPRKSFRHSLSPRIGRESCRAAMVI